MNDGLNHELKHRTKQIRRKLELAREYGMVHLPHVTIYVAPRDRYCGCSGCGKEADFCIHYASDGRKTLCDLHSVYFIDDRVLGGPEVKD